MFRDMKRYGRDPAVVRRSAPKTFSLPLNRKRDKSYAIPSGWKVFTCSWSDWFHASADEWRPEAWEIIRQRPDLTFQIVTKRTDRIAQCLPADWGDGWPNVWLIATVENQEWADVRIPQLLRVPAVVRGLSCEPLLGPVDLAVAWDGEPQAPTVQVDWVITGGESGPGARPSNPEWFRSIRDQCQAADVAYFHKQNGEWVDEFHPAGHTDGRFEESDAFCVFERDVNGRAVDYAGHYMLKVGVKAAGRDLDGVEYSEFPGGVPCPA
jgi:protein gp37